MLSASASASGYGDRSQLHGLSRQQQEEMITASAKREVRVLT
jgi:hypothetical protein